MWISKPRMQMGFEAASPDIRYLYTIMDIGSRVSKGMFLGVLRWLWLPCLVIAFAGCNDTAPANAHSPETVADSQSIAAPDSLTKPLGADDLHLDPSLPPQKPGKEIDVLNKRWNDAWEKEYDYLVSKRLQGWLDAIPDSSDEEGWPIRLKLDNQKFEELNAAELLAYQMFHPEEWSQNCAEFGEAAGNVQAISRFFPNDEDGNYWSERQMAALIKDSVAVKAVILECLSQHQVASISLMRTIAELGVREAVMPLIDIYNAQEEVKDDLILTTLMQLMERANYWKWVYSPTCKSMVVADGYFLPLDEATIGEILKFAREFAEGPSR